MNAIMYTNLSSEKKHLQELLKNIPVENVIDRLGLESRLEEVESHLGTTNSYHIPKKAKLTFRGSPVIGSEAISATFASKATNFFSDAVAAVAAGLSGTLKFMGPIPFNKTNQLMITGTAVGSFGFEFELPRPDSSDLVPEHSIVEKAVNDIRQLFEIASIGTDDDLVDLIDEIHPRAVKRICKFLNFLDEQNARCGLEFNDKFFRFQDKHQLESVISRLNEDNRSTKVIPFTGVFRGILPSINTFDFKNEIDGDVIRGKIAPEVAEKDLINPNWLFKKVTVNFTVIVIGNSKPKYVLKSLKEITIL